MTALRTWVRTNTESQALRPSVLSLRILPVTDLSRAICASILAMVQNDAHARCVTTDELPG
jgi:hypothetical protein